ncbi:MAG: transposase [Dermatophilaceae bacterium]
MQALFKPGTRARALAAGPAVRIKDMIVNSVQSQGQPIGPAREACPTPEVKHPDRVGRAEHRPDLHRIEPVAESARRGWVLGAWPGDLDVAKSYRPVLRDQPMLLPVDVRDWLPPDHLAWLVLDVVDALDTIGVERTRCRGGAGVAGYDPGMLFALLVYAYCQGVRPSRQIERLSTTDVAFAVVCAQDGPDHTTIARFRADAAGVFTDLFVQVLLMAGTAGLARFGPAGATEA